MLHSSNAVTREELTHKKKKSNSVLNKCIVTFNNSNVQKNFRIELKNKQNYCIIFRRLIVLSEE